ncbi:Uncharacterized mitochondrial protein AtMg00310 [Linum perenne]
MNALVVKFWWSGDVKTKPLHWVKADRLRMELKSGGLGFRDFENMNLAFMVKLAWRIVTQPHSLWAKMLKGLYFPATDFLGAKKHYKPSWIWIVFYRAEKSYLRVLGEVSATCTPLTWTMRGSRIGKISDAKSVQRTTVKSLSVFLCLNGAGIYKNSEAYSTMMRSSRLWVYQSGRRSLRTGGFGTMSRKGIFP